MAINCYDNSNSDRNKDINMQITIDDLTPQLKEIAEAIGLEETIALARAKGGHVIWNGQTPDPEVVEAIGLDATIKLARLFSGFAIELNTLKKVEINARARVVAAMLESGANTTQIYKRAKLTRNQARGVIRSLEKASGKNTDQISLPLP